VRPIEKAWGEYDEQGKAAADCKELARAYDLSVVVATQAATIVEEKQSKGRRAGKMDVYGSKEQVHVANTAMFITLLGKDESQTDREEWERDVFWLGDVKKNRDGATFSFKMKHHVRFGYVEEIIGEFTKEAKEAAREAIEQAARESGVIIDGEENNGSISEWVDESSTAQRDLSQEVTPETSTIQEVVTESEAELSFPENIADESIGSRWAARMRQKSIGRDIK
jgi:hypothetical protein